MTDPRSIPAAEIDRWTDRYLNAVDAVDIPVLRECWQLAESDPEVRAYLLEIHAELQRQRERRRK